MLADDSIDRTPEEGAIAGPKMEYSWWRKRVVKIGSVVEQLKGREARMVVGLKGREARMVVGVVSAAKSRLLKRWRQAPPPSHP
ncbi:hypothetical protein T484DRAFT_1817119 [Baffinella frigidus]|nr:hypothetical protein T484DRAFT_1817119 [Cryptophyta sp. CCMP2293]